MMKLADMTRLKVPHPYIAMVPQWDFLTLLAEAAAKEKTFTLRMNTEMTGLLRDDGQVVGICYQTAEGTEGELRADLVIAADGRWSLARRQAGLRPKEYDCPFDVWWFRLSRHDDEGEGTLTPRMRHRRFAVPLPRTGYFQIAYLAPRAPICARKASRRFAPMSPTSVPSSPTGCTSWRRWTTSRSSTCG